MLCEQLNLVKNPLLPLGDHCPTKKYFLLKIKAYVVGGENVFGLPYLHLLGNLLTIYSYMTNVYRFC